MHKPMDQNLYLSMAEQEYIDELYHQYQNSPNQLDPTWKRFFEGFEFAKKYGEGYTNGNSEGVNISVGDNSKEIGVSALIHAYRSRAHLLSTTNPIRKRRFRDPKLELENFGLTDADLDKPFRSGDEIGLPNASLRQIIDRLSHIYSGNIGFEYFYIREIEIRNWLKEKVEHESLNFNLSNCEKKRILFKLNEAVVFENFLHTKYVGQKRFSLEGGESTIPALDELLNRSAELGAEEVIIGMAHRGRLNVLANIMGKTYEQIFNEFEGGIIPSQSFGDGDVKYHMGFSSQIPTRSGKSVYVKLIPNPSHLEAVDPLVVGFARAKIDGIFKGDTNKSLPVLIHGDAAVAGQGVIYELTQMSRLPGYNVGGVIHFVINNQIGFTTNFDDARSSIYSTDIAKIVDAPVFHVNGDDAEKVVFVTRIAVEYRQRFNRDIFIDMVCYRRYGHNEGDEPRFTQPNLYNIISKHPNPREIYNKLLIERGNVDAQLAKDMDAEFRSMLQDRLNQVKQHPLPYEVPKFEAEWSELRRAEPTDFVSQPNTTVPIEILNKIAKALISVPENFSPLKKIEKILEERKTLYFDEQKVNWSLAELLAYGSVLIEGKTVRLTGQDVVRGTFSHRHAIIRDAETEIPHKGLDFLDENQGFLSIYNSLLSENAVMGFELGYSMANPNSLTIWEAQFGDFVNGAQVIIDQFLSTSETKWQRPSSLVLLLPHGYEGQGPEHSSARPERFLQLCANNNMVVANITTPSNLFHFFRRQLNWPFRKPAVLMSPKSLLRHPKVVSNVSELVAGSFLPAIADSTIEGKADRVIFCTGKIYYELDDYREANKITNTAIIRIEQLYPFPSEIVQQLLDKHKPEKVFWVQEEPLNMGYWSFVRDLIPHPSLQKIGRNPSSSPATGFAKVHIKEQEEIIKKAFNL